ncbi:ABC transporter permease [Nocardioides sp.]|uniref:ABC transporter permease n=1 Tax=Nocardioides sp. TaxID=35761 RepID=UPI002D7E26C1|nr:ABC transporter permease [Nocardioides sp.]HET8961429.1 ABC transporter permease [Nocardioides sp.]
MSAVTTTAVPTLDLSATSAVPFRRLIGVEVRKMSDTRAGMWLLGAVGLITVAVVTIFFFAADDGQRTFLNFMLTTASPQGFVLPVLGILLVTSEWGQRTTLTTFTLEPSRQRVIAAKVVAALLFGLVAIVLAVGIAALATVLAGEPGAWDDIGADDFAKFGILQIGGIMQGLAFGLIFLNSAAAIVSYFVLPLAVSIVAQIWAGFRDIAAWVDFNTAQQPLFSGVDVTGEQWAQLATASAIWILLPFLAGLVRVTRAEVK